jgi:hypothetical protein
MVLIKSRIPRIQYTRETELGLNKNYSKADSLKYVSDVLHVHIILSKELLYGSYFSTLLYNMLLRGKRYISS